MHFYQRNNIYKLAENQILMMTYLKAGNSSTHGTTKKYKAITAKNVLFCKTFKNKLIKKKDLEIRFCYRQRKREIVA